MIASLGVIIVTFNSEDEIIDCLNGLAAAPDIRLEVVVVDNASKDTTCPRVAAWPRPENMSLNLLKKGENAGFAAGVNAGFSTLLARPHLDRFWVLNPDCVCTPNTPNALALWPDPFALLGCRINYASPSDQIQIDGGTLNRWTGATGNVNIGKPARATPPPDSASLDFISGASMVASRAFVEAAGPMPEDYFLYYEEVDWATRRGALPLGVCTEARVYHKAGASIGSPTLLRGPSPVSVYFKHRARLRFVARNNPVALPVAYGFGWLKIAQNLVRGQFAAALSAVRAIHWLPPSASVKRAISPNPQAATKDLTAEIRLS